jgi:hypothetical protein
MSESEYESGSGSCSNYESESDDQDDDNVGPQIVKIGDNKEHAEWVKGFYFKHMDASTLANVNHLIANMPEDGPIPYELKNIFYIIAEQCIDYSNSRNDIDHTIIVGVAGKNITFAPIIHGVEINNKIIIRTANKWYIYHGDIGFIMFICSSIPYDNMDSYQIHANTFIESKYFTCDKAGKYYINDKVFYLQDGNDLVYKDQFLIRCNPSITNYTIMPPEIVGKVAERRYFACELVGYSLSESITLIIYNDSYFVAKCPNLGEKNIFKVYAESKDYYKGKIKTSRNNFSAEQSFYINDVEALYVETESSRISEINPGETFQYKNQTFKNHYSQTINITTFINYENIIYVLTELGLVYEISKGSGKHTKSAIIE